MQRIDSNLDFQFDGKRVHSVTCDMPYDESSIQVSGTKVGDNLHDIENRCVKPATDGIMCMLHEKGYNSYISAHKVIDGMLIVVGYGVKDAES